MRQRIIQRASQLFRQRGYNGVSIDNLMSEAGLTRGGFYSHFKNKADLFACVIEYDPELTQRLRERDGKDPKALREGAIDIVQDYVSKRYRKQVLKGCSLASLAMETSRAPAEAQCRYAAAIRDLAAELSRGVEANQSDSERGKSNAASAPLDERALMAIVTALGGLVLANATAADRELADSFSAAAQSQLAELLSDVV